MDRVAGRLSRTAGDDDAAACLAYTAFCDRLTADGGCAVQDAERVAEALIAVHRNHRDYWCVVYTGRLLARLVGSDDGGGRRLLGNAARVAAMEVLIQDRPRTMTEDLVEKSF